MALGASGGSAGAIRAGAAFVELSLRDNKFAASLAAIRGKLASAGRGLTSAGAAAAAAGVGLLAPLKLVADTLDDTRKLGGIADAFGLTTEAASRLFGVMKSAGSDVRDATEGIITFGQRVQDALAGKGDEAQDLFRKLKVGASEFANLAPDEQFYKLIESLDGVDKKLQNSLLLKAVGEDTGKNLIQLVGKSRAELEELDAQFQITAADMKVAKEASASYTKATAALSQAWLKLSVALAPAVKVIADGLSSALKPVLEFVGKNQALVAGFGAAAAAALATGAAALVGVGLAASVAGVALSGLAAAAGAAGSVVAGALSLALSPAGLAVAAIAGIGYAVYTMSDDVKGAVGGLVAGISGKFAG